MALLATYALGRVRELHESGESWAESVAGRVRRDTHAGTIPSDVLEWLSHAMRRCPALYLVVVERLGDSFVSPAAAGELRADVMAVRAASSALDASTDSAGERVPLEQWPNVRWDAALPVAQGALCAAHDAVAVSNETRWSVADLSPRRATLCGAEPKMIATAG